MTAQDVPPGHPTVRLARSVCPGADWPAVPGPADARILALAWQLVRSQWWPPAVLEGWQLRQAGALIAHARRTVPYYAARFGGGDSGAAGMASMEAFRRLPLLRRQDVQAAGDDLVSREVPRDHGSIGEIRTSGSTGRPVTVKNSAVTQTYFLALTLRYHLWHGRDLTADTAAIRLMSAADAERAEADPGSPWATAHRSGTMYTFPVSRPVAEQYAWLARHDAAYLVTTPSNLLALIRHADERGLPPPPGLRQVVTMGEVVDPMARETCRDRWGVPLVDSYSSQELGLIAPQCPDHDHYHVNAENVLVEVLDADGRPCAPGQVGRLVITDLHNFAMPLIRYEIGDHAEVGPACSCGRGLPVLRRILGRTRNMLVLPDGGEVWPGFGVKRMGRIDAIRQIQVVQRSVSRIDIRLVTGRPLSADEEATVRDALASRLPPVFDIRIVYVDDIPRSASGKFEDFVSEVRPRT